MKKTLVATVAIAISIALVLSFPSAAQAHDELVSTSPAADASLQTPPTSVVLTFEASPLRGTTKIIAKSASGTRVDLGDPSVNGAIATVAWPATAPNDSYTISWRNVGSDGHALDGTFSFSYVGGASASASPSPASPEPSMSSDGVEPVKPKVTSTDNTVLEIVGIILILIVIITVIAIIMRRRSSENSPPTT